MDGYNHTNAHRHKYTYTNTLTHRSTLRQTHMNAHIRKNTDIYWIHKHYTHPQTHTHTN